jgi:hypothetical protein
LLEVLRKEAGRNPVEDGYKRGYLEACYDIQHIEITEVELPEEEEFND